MSLRSTFYDALRAAPLYPRGRAMFALFLVAVAIGEVTHGWWAAALLFLALAGVGIARADGAGRAVLTGLLAAGVAAGCTYVVIAWSAGVLALAGLALWAAVTVAWLMRQVMPTFTTRGLIERRGDRVQRAGGVASPWDLAERASRAALRRRAAVLRPSLRDVPRRRIDPWQIGVLVVALDGWWGAHRLTRHIREVWSALEDTTLRIGGPRTGKTLSLALIAARAPGALMTTSTRLDLAEWVHEVRRVRREYGQRSFWEWLRRRPRPVVAEHPRPVHVFNPTGYGAVPSTVRWSILVGCEDYTTAARRAADMIPESPSAEGERWDRMARQYLPVLLNAAAMSGRGVEDVVRWVRDLGDSTGKERAKREITDVLAQDPAADQRIGLLQQFVGQPDRTRGSVTAMMTPALAWVSDDTARSIGAAPVATVTLDIRRFILEQETLHIVGPDAGGGMLAPLTSALVAEIAYQARMVASTMPGERLDPALTMALDEIAVTVQLPLDQWSADMGGRGVALHMAAQSLSQLHERWGVAGAGTLLGNVGTMALYGGGKDAVELAKVSALCGERYRQVVGGAGEDFDGDGKKWDRVPVLTPSDLTNMPPGFAAVLQRNLGGVVVGHPPTTVDAGMQKVSLLTGDVIVGETLEDLDEDGASALVGMLDSGVAA